MRLASPPTAASSEILDALDDPGDPVTVAAAFGALVPGILAPLPGAGATWARLELLARTAEASPALARLLEGHLDAVAILAELGAATPAGARLGVWAAEPRGAVITASRTAAGWRLRGTKPYASGAGALTHALLTARDGDERLLFLVPAARTAPVPGTWAAVGMAGSASPDVAIDATLPADALIGGPGSYLHRPGFWHGGVGVAACWHGGAVGVASPLRAAAAARDASAHALAHLGAVEAALAASEATLRAAAAAIDDDPVDRAGGAERRARLVRAITERAATDTLHHVGRALGAGPLCHDRAHARRVADLTVYLRQSHAEGDLEALGRLAARAGA
jgi:hypothetical protein